MRSAAGTPTTMNRSRTMTSAGTLCRSLMMCLNRVAFAFDCETLSPLASTWLEVEFFGSASFSMYSKVPCICTAAHAADFAPGTSGGRGCIIGLKAQLGTKAHYFQ